MLSKSCLICNTIFYNRRKNKEGQWIGKYTLKQWAIKAKYCSFKCYWQARKGVRISRNTEFKKGIVPWDKGVERPEIMNERNPNWKGDKVGYMALHAWVGRKLGKPSYCTHCFKTEGKFEWANKSGEYKRDLDDWIRLCKSCHNKYDDIGNKIWKIRRNKA